MATKDSGDELICIYRLVGQWLLHEFFSESFHFTLFGDNLIATINEQYDKKKTHSLKYMFQYPWFNAISICFFFSLFRFAFMIFIELILQPEAQQQ